MKTFQQFCEVKDGSGSERWYEKWIPKIMQWEKVDEQEARKLARRFLDYEQRMSPQAIARIKDRPDKPPPPPPFRVTVRDEPIYFGNSPHLCHKCGRELVPPDEDFCDKCRWGGSPNWMKAKSPPEEKNWWDEL
jgi:hypothetical protein